MDNNTQDQDVTVLVDQTTGMPMFPNDQQPTSQPVPPVNQPVYPNAQQPMGQPVYGQPMNQTNYTNMQQPMGQSGYGQPMNHTGYPNMQQPMGQPGYGQQMNHTGYPNMQQPMGQPGYGQPMNQTGYPNMQQQMGQSGYGQQPQYGGYQNNYAGPNNGMTPGMKVNPKVLAIVAAIIVVAILAIVFVPKLFAGGKDKDPFHGLELGMDRKEVCKELGIKDNSDDEYLYADVDAFGVPGRLQMVFDDDELDRCNWYVDDYDCDSEKEFEKAAENIEKTYTKKYGKPDKDTDGDETKYVWEDDDYEFELAVDENDFVLRWDESASSIWD